MGGIAAIPEPAGAAVTVSVGAGLEATPTANVPVGEAGGTTATV